MPITKRRTKIKNDGKWRNYISYFQSVTTIGVISKARSLSEAEEKAKINFECASPTCGVIDQTPFEMAETEPFDTNIGFASV